MKKAVIIIISLIILLSIIAFIGSGFTENYNVHILDYTVSPDGEQLTFDIIIPTSIGYTRGFKDAGGGVKPHYLTFYNTFGGINSSFGAKSEFVLDLGEDDTEIYFNRTGGGYELVLVKDKSGNWQRP